MVVLASGIRIVKQGFNNLIASVNQNTSKQKLQITQLILIQEELDESKARTQNENCAVNALPEHSWNVWHILNNNILHQIL